MKGIDVSSYQGIINWNSVKPQIDFAIIRCGYGDDFISQDDQRFEENINGCIENNIPYAVYLYSYAKNLTGQESIESEVNHVLRKIKDKSPFCVYIDMEDDSTKYLGRTTLTKYAKEFCKKIKQAGYKAGVYANEYWFQNLLNLKEISQDNNSIWIAKYSSTKPNVEEYDIWQYSSSGTINGIIGDVDLNIMETNQLIIDKEENQVNVYYKVKTKNTGWLPEVKNLTDYAGYQNNPIIGLAIRVDKGSIKYRVHIKGKQWLPYVTGYNIKDTKNGYAGNNQIIDAVEVYYNTPNNIRPYKKAKYKINNNPWQYDKEKTNGQDGYAGKLGKNATKFQIIIE